MRKTILLIIAICFYLSSHAQNLFKSGYFIDNSNVKHECFLKDKNEKNNPANFRYKLFINEKTQIGIIDSVKEFGIYPDLKFIKFRGKIDRTGFDDKSTTHNQNPEFQEETLFLKVLCEGKASLYSYTDGPLVRYFYKTEECSIKQLVYKDFKVMNLSVPSRNYIIRQNKTYLSQLMSDLVDPSITFEDIKKLAYKKSDLVNIFNKFNGINLAKTEVSKQNKGIFNLLIKSGVNYSSMWTNNEKADHTDIIFPSKWEPRLGVELEYVLPYFNNKWTLFTEPNLHFYYSEGPVHLGNAYAKFQSIDLPLGFKHYLFLGKKSKIFIKASLMYNFHLNSRIEYDKYWTLDLLGKISPNFGIGYQYLDKYSLDISFGRFSNLTYVFLTNSSYQYMSIIFGYKLYNFKRNEHEKKISLTR